MNIFGRMFYVFTYTWILLCINISNSLTEGNKLTVCAGNEASFNSNLSHTSTVFIIVFKKGPNTIGTYQPENGIFIDAKYKDRYSIVKERYGITLKISDTQVLDQGFFVCEITYRTGPDVIKELHLIVKERENSSLIMFDEMRQGSNTLITCSAIRGQVELKMPDNTTKTCSCCFIEQCSADVCKTLTLTLNESDVDHPKVYKVNDGTMVKRNGVGILVSALCNCILVAIIIVLLETKNFKRIKEDVTNGKRKNRKSKFKILSCGCTSNEEDMDKKSDTCHFDCTPNEKYMYEKSNALTYGESSKADVQVESDALTYGESSKADVQVESDIYLPFEGETIPLNHSTSTGETKPLKEIMEIHSRSGSRDDTGTYVSQISKDSIKSN